MQPLRDKKPKPTSPAAKAVKKLPAAAQADADLLLSAVSSQSARIDLFATWILALVGGVATLLISNLDGVVTQMPRHYVSLGLFLLGLAALSGVIEKWLAVVVQVSIGAASTVKAGLTARSVAASGSGQQNFDSVDVFDQVVRAQPWFLKGRIVRSIVKAHGDPLFVGRRNTRLTAWQSLLVGFELLLLVAFIFVMARGVWN